MLHGEEHSASHRSIYEVARAWGVDMSIQSGVILELRGADLGVGSFYRES